MLTIFDSHWLPYRNAEVRAFALDNKTVPLDFYNITDSESGGDNIGRVVNTDERGFLHYGGGQGLQNVECLAVAESAIIQVSRPTGEILGQWTLKEGAKPLTANDLGTLKYADGTLAFNPAVPREWTLRNFALASDVRKGIWQEAQTVVLDNDAEYELSKWQSVIYIPGVFTHQTLNLNVSRLVADAEPRFGLKFLIVNGSDHDIKVSQAGTDISAIIPAGRQMCACAVLYLDVVWKCALALDDTPAEVKALQESSGRQYIRTSGTTSASYSWDETANTTTVQVANADADDISVSIDFNAVFDATSHSVGFESVETLRIELPADSVNKRWLVVAQPEKGVSVWHDVHVEFAIAGTSAEYKRNTNVNWKQPFAANTVMMVAETQATTYKGQTVTIVSELHTRYLNAYPNGGNFNYNLVAVNQG